MKQNRFSEIKDQRELAWVQMMNMEQYNKNGELLSSLNISPNALKYNSLWIEIDQVMKNNDF